MTVQELRDRLALYVAAEAAILGAAQEYQVGQGSTARRLTRADLTEVRDEIRRLQGEIDRATALASGSRRITYLRPF